MLFLPCAEKNIHITIAETEGANILNELVRLEGDHEIVKKRYSAFFGTELAELLTDLGISEIILAGINTHACIRMTAIDAYQLDLNVVIPEECVASRDQQHHDVTLRYLADEIAEVVSLESVSF